MPRTNTSGQSSQISRNSYGSKYRSKKGEVDESLFGNKRADKL